MKWKKKKKKTRPTSRNSFVVCLVASVVVVVVRFTFYFIFCQNLYSQRNAFGPFGLSTCLSHIHSFIRTLAVSVCSHFDRVPHTLPFTNIFMNRSAEHMRQFHYSLFHFTLAFIFCSCCAETQTQFIRLSDTGRSVSTRGCVYESRQMWTNRIFVSLSNAHYEYVVGVGCRRCRRRWMSTPAQSTIQFFRVSRESTGRKGE